MFNQQIKKIRIMFEVFPPVNSNRIQEGHSKLITSVEFHSLGNRSQGKLSYFKDLKYMYFVQLCGKGPKLEASIAVCSTEIKVEKEISCE